MGMAQDPDWITAYFYFLKTHRLPKPMGAYDNHTLHAFFGYMEEACQYTGAQAEAEMARRADEDGDATWEEPVYTGDPVVDAWERAIAEGRDPEL